MAIRRRVRFDPPNLVNEAVLLKNAVSANFLDALREFSITPGEEAEVALARQLQARPLQITSYICPREENPGHPAHWAKVIEVLFDMLSRAQAAGGQSPPQVAATQRTNLLSPISDQNRNATFIAPFSSVSTSSAQA